jgi:hypothetical protein
MENFRVKIDRLLLDLGFEKVLVNNTLNYKYNECYHKITYIDRFKSFVLESAESYADAKKMHMKIQIYIQSHSVRTS